MSKFKSLLTKDERQEIALKAEFYGHHYWEFDGFCEQLEQAVLTKLQEQQDAIAIIGPSFNLQYIDSSKVGDIKGLEVGMKLYAQPCVSPVNDKPACESQNKECDKQSTGFVKQEYANEQHEALCNMFDLARVKYGNLDPDLERFFSNALAVINDYKNHVVQPNEMVTSQERAVNNIIRALVDDKEIGPVFNKIFCISQQVTGERKDQAEQDLKAFVSHVLSNKGKAEFDLAQACLELGIKAGKPRRSGYGWDDEATPSNKVIIQLMAKYHLQMLTGSDYEKVIDFGRDVWNFAQEKMQSEPQKTVGKVRLKVELSTKEAQETIQGLVDAVDGYQLVPKEPTPDMIKAGVSLAMKSHLHGSYTWTDYMRDLYIAMLAKAPKLGDDL